MGKLEMIKFRLDTKYNDIEFIIGNSFRLYKGKFYFNTTPYCDATLVSMHNINLNRGFFEFDYKKNTKINHCKMNLLSSEMALLIADFILHVNLSNVPYELNNCRNNFEFSYDEKKGMQLSIEKTDQSERIVIYFNKKADSFLVLVYPEPLKRFCIKRISLKKDILYIETEGPNLWNANDVQHIVSYSWCINLQKDIGELLEKLLELGIKYTKNN